MKRYRTGYYIKEGVSSIFTHGFMSFASVCIIVACLIIMGSFALLAVNVNAIIGDLENENILLVYIDDRLDDTQVRALEKSILAVPNVSRTDFISREEAMSSFVGKYEDPTRFQDIDATVFRHRYAVFVEDVELTSETQDALADIQGVAWVNANLKVARGLVTVRNIVSGVSVVLVAILLVISLFIMSNTIKLATFERREEIAIMRMVGATNQFIRWPFVFEGFILGMIGSIVAYVAQWGLYGLVTKNVVNAENPGFITTIPFSSTAIPLLIVFVIIGFGVGVGGSVMAIRKYLKV